VPNLFVCLMILNMFFLLCCHQHGCFIVGLGARLFIIFITSIPEQILLTVVFWICFFVNLSLVAIVKV